jgi:short-subunit dehydrogenase
MQKFVRKIVILGASRGLGWATYQNFCLKYPEAEFVLVSRKIQSTPDLQSVIKIAADFSKGVIEEAFLQQIVEFNPSEIIYCAGGGPYGNFENKKWSDHQWALNVNFLYPAQLIHQILNHKDRFLNLKSITCIGSRVAENRPDEKASSYAAAKHALRGLISTLQIENTSAIQLKLFSPGYILTNLLPVNSLPRLENLAEDPAAVAEKLVEFIDSDQIRWPKSENR